MNGLKPLASGCALTLFLLSAHSSAVEPASPCASRASSDESSLQQAAEAGQAEAQYQLGLFYAESDNAFDSDLSSAMYWYKQAAAQGHACAQYNLASGYQKGLGIRQNAEKAFYWYRKAALQGDRDAQYNLAVSYEQGLGVAPDPEQALHWYQKAADQGDPDARHELERRKTKTLNSAKQ